ncbi:iron permease [Mycena olivaceomarginata]|nr:iron permease [Mycena olivaceomarginata]
MELNTLRKYGATWRFWMIFMCVMLSQFITALELSVVSTALPYYSQFVWIGSAYTLCSTAFVPLSGSLAEIFGRKILMSGSIVIFAVGSALCGAANSLNFLIAGRAVQGLGAGGLASLCHIILSDLVPRKREESYTIANGIGPVVGGSLAQNGQWRWIFCEYYTGFWNAHQSLHRSKYPDMRVHPGARVLFLNLRAPSGSFATKLKKIDIVGNILVVASTTSVMIGLTWGGVQYACLILGCVGLGLFLWYEFTVATNPMLPRGLLVTRTALSGFIQTSTLFVVSHLPTVLYACILFKHAWTPLRSPPELISLVLPSALPPSALLVGLSIAKTRQYRPQIWLSWSLAIIGLGLFTTLDVDSSRAKAIGFQIIPGVGLGMMTAAIFFPILAPLPVESNRACNRTVYFLPQLFKHLAVTVGGTVLQNELGKTLTSSVFSAVSSGHRDCLLHHSPHSNPARAAQVANTSGICRQLTRCLASPLGVSAAGFLISLAMKRLPLHTEVDKKWGIDDPKDGIREKVGSEAHSTTSIEPA